MDSHIAYRRTYSMTRPIGAAVTEINLGLSELARLAMGMAAFVAGMMSSIFDGRPARQSPLPKPIPIARIAPRPIKPPPPEALPLLSEAIVGSSKYTIARVLGSPRSSVVEGLAAIEKTGCAGFFQADTWYYPLPRHGQITMAVIFTDDVAQSVEFFHAPETDRPRRQ